MVDIQSSVSALRSDAGVWDSAAQDVECPRQAIGSLGLLSMQSLTTTISTEQNTIAQKVHDLGDQWAKSNLSAMQEKSDWRLMR
jgi:hypothetical protein